MKFIYLLTKAIIFFCFIINIHSQNLKAQQDHIENVPQQPARTIEFSGCTWHVKSGFYGPGPNYWSNSEQSVWLDDKGRLHLKIRKINGRWYCAEVFTPQYTRYGEHRFLIEGDVEQFDQNVVLGLFVYADDTHEIDIEYSKWGNPNFQNIGSFTVQPWTIRENIERFAINLDSLRTTHSFIWQENYILFSSYQGHYEGLFPSPDYLIHKWIYWGDYIPQNSDNLRTHLNFWLFNGDSPVDTTDLEIIITNVIQPISTGLKSGEQLNEIADNYQLQPNYPNPFVKTTTIRYWLKQPDFIKIEVFDILGKRVKTLVNSYKTPNEYVITFNAENLPPGVYFYRIQGNNFNEIRKMILMR